jgi:RimJ/RimL family protein N-acetyltransferase
MKIIQSFQSKTGKNIEIVEPSMDRLDDVLLFVNKLAKEDTYLSFHPGKEILRDDEEKWLQGQIKSIEDGASLLYWAISDGKIVGLVDVRRGKSVREWHVGTIAIMVDIDFRGEGLGKFLMELILKYAKEVGIRTVKLDAFSDNEIAISLYKKVGFTVFGVLPDGLYRQKKFSDRVYMYKQLLD